MSFHDEISINLQPHCDVISLSRKTLYHTLLEEITLIIELKGEYYLIQDEYDKVFDVSRMPEYIKQDWINYNKKPIENYIIIDHIKEYEERVNWQYPPNDNTIKSLDKLKSIKRDITIRKIV